MVQTVQKSDFYKYGIAVFLQAVVEYALRKPELKDDFIQYLKAIVEE